MKNCQDREELLSEMIFGVVSEEEAFEAHEHLAECDGCMNFYISLYETLADTDGEELADGLTIAQKAQIFATAKQIDQKQEEKKVKKFRWSTPLSFAAAVTISGIIILPELMPSLGSNVASYETEKSISGKIYEEYDLEYPALESAPEKEVGALSNAPSPEKPSTKRGKLESYYKRNKSTLTTVNTTLAGSADDVALEDSADARPSTDDNMVSESLNDVVVSLSSTSRGSSGANKKASEGLEELDVLEESDEEVEFVDAGKRRESRQKSEEFDSKLKQKNQRLSGIINELNNENDAFKNQIGKTRAMNTRMFKQLEELKEITGSSRVKSEVAQLDRQSLKKKDNSKYKSDFSRDENEKPLLQVARSLTVNGSVAVIKREGYRDNTANDLDGAGSTGSDYISGKKKFKKATSVFEYNARKTIYRGKGQAIEEVLADGSQSSSNYESVIEPKKLLKRSLVNKPAVAELVKVNIVEAISGRGRNQSIDEIGGKWSDSIDEEKKEKEQDEVAGGSLANGVTFFSGKAEQAPQGAANFLTAEKDIKDGDYLKAIYEYSKQAKEPHIIEKLKDVEKRLAVVKEKLKPKEQTRRQMIVTATVPQSTFSIDVDTASYQMAKSIIQKGGRPNPMLVRAEEFINYFKYNYEAPKKDAFKVHTELTVSPFHRGSHIMKIGVQGRRPGGDHRSASHFCFIVDTSGSMAADGRLPLVKKVLPMIAKQMSAGDKVSLISCGLKARLELDYVDIANLDKIYERIEALNAVGATNLEASIVGGYNHVLNHLKPGTYNRVILLSDGVANVGEANANKILAKLEIARQKGVGITVIGMGENEYNDNFLETMADKGDGNYLFIDRGKEARKAFEENFAATFHTIAYNVKIQVEFDPRQVASYRLLGYENRRLKNKDFRNDKVDAGEVGSGQSVTAIYELEMTGNRKTEALAEVRLRYRDAIDNKMKEFATPVKPGQAGQSFEKASKATKLALLVGKFAEVLRDGGNSEGITVNDLLKHLRPLNAEFNDSDVAVLVQLLEKTK